MEVRDFRSVPIAHLSDDGKSELVHSCKEWATDQGTGYANGLAYLSENHVHGRCFAMNAPAADDDDRLWEEWLFNMTITPIYMPFKKTMFCNEGWSLWLQESAEVDAKVAKCLPEWAKEENGKGADIVPSE